MLQLNDVCYRYPGADDNALNHISLNLKAGNITGVLGPNGAGKTTLFSLLTGLLKPSSGSLVWSSERPTVSLVPQHLAFYGQLSILENLHFFADIYQLSKKTRQQQLTSVIDACDLGSRLKQTAGTLSGGWQRRLNFAIGILQPAQLYLFDEATVGVDAASRAQLLHAVRVLGAEGKTLLYTSHYLQETEQIANRVLLLNNGQIQLDTAIDQLSTAQELIVEWPTNTPADWLALLQQSALQLSVLASGHRISGYTAVQLQQLMQYLLDADPAPSLIRLGRPSLEQLYLQLTGGQI